MNTRQCEAELYKKREQVIDEFKQGMVTEENYKILEQWIEEYLKEIREELEIDSQDFKTDSKPDSKP